MKSSVSCFGENVRFEGEIILGRGVGETLGFPTLNFKIPEKFELAEGVYACKLFAKHSRSRTKNQEPRTRFGVLFFGKRQTFDNQKALEVHILDEVLALSPNEAKVEVLDRIREVKKFENEDELKKQIKKDCLVARKILKKNEI